MDDNQVNGLMTLFLYGIDNAPDLGSSTVDMVVDDLLNQVHYRQPPQDFFEAFGAVLRSGRIPPQAMHTVRRYRQPEILYFIDRLHTQLDEARPWPSPRFRKLDVSQWPAFANARIIARIETLSSRIEGMFHHGFDRVPAGAVELPVLLLELRSGEQVAIVGSTARGASIYTLLAQDPADPAATIAHLLEVSALTPEEVKPV